MAYDAPEAATADLAGKAEQAAPDLPDAPNAPPSLEQVESANPPDADPGHGVTGTPSSSASDIVGAEADEVQLEGPKLKDEDGTGLTGGPIGN